MRFLAFAAVALVSVSGSAFADSTFWKRYNQTQQAQPQYQPPVSNNIQVQRWGNQEYRSGTHNGQQFNSQVQRWGNTTIETGTIGGKPFKRTCTTYGNVTTCN